MTMGYDIGMVENEYDDLISKIYNLRKEIGDFNLDIQRFFREYENMFGAEDTDTPAYMINKEYEKIEDKTNQIINMVTNMITEFRLTMAKRKF